MEARARLYVMDGYLNMSLGALWTLSHTRFALGVEQAVEQGQNIPGTAVFGAQEIWVSQNVSNLVFTL
jgi:hypothetical protein